MKDGLRFVDSDMHVMEPPDLFERYLDPKYRDRVSVRIGADGRPNRGAAGQILIDGQVTSDADLQQYRKRSKPVAKNSTQPLSGSRIFEAKRLDFAIERDYDPHYHLFCVDLAADTGMHLSRRQARGESVRYLRAEGLGAQIEAMRAELRQGRVSVDSGAGAAFPIEEHAALLGIIEKLNQTIVAGGQGRIDLYK